jgi:hypothetical protein
MKQGKIISTTYQGDQNAQNDCSITWPDVQSTLAGKSSEHGTTA